MHEHEQRETLQIDIFYPDHPPRTESALFRKTKRSLIQHRNVPCFVCGATESREVHHFHVEWADADGVDWDKMRQLHPGFDWEQFSQPEDFVDSEYNMMVLCEKHHRGKNHGIHMLPYPIWIMQRNQRPDFIFSADEQKKGVTKDGCVDGH